MYRLLKPSITVTHIKPSLGPLSAQICIQRKKSPSILIAFKDKSIKNFLEKMPKEKLLDFPPS